MCQKHDLTLVISSSYVYHFFLILEKSREIAPGKFKLRMFVNKAEKCYQIIT